MRAVAAAAMLAIALPLLAHGDGERPLSAVLWNGATAAVLLGAALLYAAGLARMWRSEAGRQTIRPWQAAAFFVGLVSAALALLSRIDALSDVLFSMHMAQHEILMLISAPGIILGRPMIPVLWAFPAAMRGSVGRALRLPQAVTLWELCTGALTVLVLHAVVLWAWHVPVLFEAALASESVHAFQHLGFFVTAALFWWALVHGRYGRLGYGIGVMYVFATAMHTQILGALLTFGGRLWYPTHASRTLAAGVDPLADQQLAGVVMWVPFGVIFVLIGLALFAAWLGEAERRVRFGSADTIARERHS